jgi:hypothetical protein
MHRPQLRFLNSGWWVSLKMYTLEGAFGDDIDYAKLVKIYGPSPEGQRRYSPAECIGAGGKKVRGKPDARYVSTSYAERNNRIIRQHCKRYASHIHARFHNHR